MNIICHRYYSLQIERMVKHYLLISFIKQTNIKCKVLAFSLLGGESELDDMKR